jgi:hypothetical protein
MSNAFDRSGDVVNRTGYYTPQALFVSFVVTILYLCESLVASPFLFSADTAKSLVLSA